MNILLVDDDKIFRKSIAIIIEREGHTVTLADSADEALEILHSSNLQFDAIITDMQMPGMLGTELLNAIQNKGSEVPCLLHSSEKYGIIPGKGNCELSEVSSVFPFARFHSKMERRYVQSFLQEVSNSI